VSYFDTLDEEKVDAACAKFVEQAPEKIARTGGDVRFALYLHLVDRRVQGAIGLGYEDLPDYPFYDEYEAGTPPREVAHSLLEENGYES